MTDHTGPEPTPTTAVPAAGGWDDAVRPTDQLLGDQESTGQIPPQRPDPDHPLPTHSQDTAGAHLPHGECEVSVTRRRVLRLLELGHTFSEVAEHLGVDPELINRWDDDAATDAHTDLLAAGLTGLAPSCAEGWWR